MGYKQITLVLSFFSILLLVGCMHTPDQPAPLPDEQPTEQQPTGGTIGAACQSDSECQLPGEFAMQSNCAFEALCIESSCTVVCPVLPTTNCADDTGCDCSSRGTKSTDCICQSGRCLSVESGNVSSEPTGEEAPESPPPADPVSRPTHPNLERVNLPPGFQIDLFATVDNARSLEVVEDANQLTVFVGNRNGDNVYAVVDTNKDYIADETYTLASNRDMPNGVAYKDGDLYVAESSSIHRFPNILNQLDNPTSEVVFDQLPQQQSHGRKYIAFGPDGLLYVPIGAPCNICDPGEPYAAIHRLDLDSDEFEMIAEGVRNTVGFDWHPDTNELWFTDNGRDWFGDNRPPDELNHLVSPPTDFGYPHCHGDGIADPEFGTVDCAEFTSPVVELGPHVAALGMEFYTGEMFPADYTNQIFIAEHGSWNRSPATGYRLTLVDPAAATYTTFADGRLGAGETTHGRPVDIEQLDDGSLLVSDDHAGLIYRIWYQE